MAYRNRICQGTYGRPLKKFPKEWQGKKRECPCCGRMIYSRMGFATHGDPAHPTTQKERDEQDAINLRHHDDKDL